MTHETTNLGIKLLKYNQAQKEITANEAFITLDALVNPSAEDILEDLALAQRDGKIYIINSELVFYCSGWRYIKPKTGWVLWLRSKDSFYTFDGLKWNPIRITCTSCKLESGC